MLAAVKDGDEAGKQMGYEDVAVIGTDVEALFPSLRDVEVARIARQAVEESGANFGSVDYESAMKYLLITGGACHIKELGLEQVAPRWAGQRQDLLTVGGEGLESKEKWTNCGRELLEHQKKKIIGRVVETAVLVCMGTHPYCFGEELFLQQEGGPIGMRFTASLANLVMKM